MSNKIEFLSEKQQEQLAQDLSDAMMGGNSIGHSSLLTYVFKDYDITDESCQLDWSDSLAFCQSKGHEIEECPCCGWVTEGNFYEHPDYESGVCDNCAEEE
jgi:hypothetical protein